MSILFAHLLELAFHMRVPATSEIGRQISESSQALLLFRSVAFSLFPLVMSAGMLRRQGSPIDRVTLRRPFYLQCFYVAPFAVVISSAIILGRLPYPGALPAALVIGLAVSVWYVMVEAGWLRSRLNVGWPRAVGVAVILFASAMLLAFALGFAILMPSVDFSLG